MLFHSFGFYMLSATITFQIYVISLVIIFIGNWYLHITSAMTLMTLMENSQGLACGLSMLGKCLAPPFYFFLGHFFLNLNNIDQENSNIDKNDLNDSDGVSFFLILSLLCALCSVGSYILIGRNNHKSLFEEYDTKQRQNQSDQKENLYPDILNELTEMTILNNQNDNFSTDTFKNQSFINNW